MQHAHMQHAQLHQYFISAAELIRQRLGSYGGGVVVGHSLEAVLDKVIRRHHWKHRNAPLTLPSATRGEEII